MVDKTTNKVVVEIDPVTAEGRGWSKATAMNEVNGNLVHPVKKI